MLKLTALQGIRRIVDATGRHASRRLGMGKLAGLPYNRDLPKQLRKDARDLTKLTAQLVEQEKIDPILVAHQTSIELDAAQLKIDSYHERIKGLEKELETVRSELEQSPTLEEWEELNEAVISLRIQLKSGKKLLAMLESEMFRTKGRGVKIDDISLAVDHVESIISGEMKESERMDIRAYLDTAQRMFEQANDPALLYDGIRIAEFNFKIGRKAKAEKLFSFILKFETEEESEFSPDKIRSAVVASYIQTGELEQAVNVAREIKDPRERFDAFLGIADAFRRSGDFSAVKDCLLMDCVEAAEAEIDYGFYGRESRLIVVIKKLIEINERKVAKGILKDIAENLSFLDKKQREVLGRVGILLVNIGEDQEAIDMLSRGSGINDGNEIKKLELVAKIFPDVYAAINKANQYVLSGIGEIINKTGINAHERIGMGDLAGLPYLSDIAKDIRKEARDLTVNAAQLVGEEKLDPILVAHQGLVELDTAQNKIDNLQQLMKALEEEFQILKEELKLRPIKEEFNKLKEQYRRLREEFDLNLPQAEGYFNKVSLDEKYFDSDSEYHAALVKFARSRIKETAWVDKSLRILRLVYAGSSSKFVDGLDIIDRLYEDLINGGIDPLIVDGPFNLIIPFLVYANCPKTGSLKSDSSRFPSKDTVRVYLPEPFKREYHFKIIAESPDWFGPTMEALAKRIISLHEKGIDITKYDYFYSAAIHEMFVSHSPTAVLEAMEHVYRAMLAGKGRQYCAKVIRFENEMQFWNKQRLLNPEDPEKLSEEDYQKGIIVAAKRWEIELGLIGEDYEDRDPVEFNVSEARKALSEGQLSRALNYLEGWIRGYISEGERPEAEQLLIEIQRIIEEVDDPKLFQWALRIAAHNFLFGREDEAAALLSLVARYVNGEKNNAIRDNMLIETAMTYKFLAEKDIRQMKKAEEAARKIEDLPARFDTFREISKAYFENDGFGKLRVGAAVNCLMANCFKIAESSADVTQFMVIAKLLVEWEAEEEAEKVLDEVADNQLPPFDHMSNYDQEKLQEVAVLLLKIGKRQKAIDLMTRGWLDLRRLSPRDREERKLKFIKSKKGDPFWDKFIEALFAK